MVGWWKSQKSQILHGYVRKGEVKFNGFRPVRQPLLESYVKEKLGLLRGMTRPPEEYVRINVTRLSRLFVRLWSPLGVHVLDKK